MTMHLDARYTDLLGRTLGEVHDLALERLARRHDDRELAAGGCPDCGGSKTVRVTHVTADGLLITREACPLCCERCGGTGFYPDTDPLTGDITDRYGCDHEGSAA
jgi:hypothetical protein